MSTAASKRSNSRSKHTEANENELGNPKDPIPFPPSRSPLNSIQDPSQISANGPSTEPSPAKSDNPIKFTGSTPRSVRSFPSKLVSRVSNGGAKDRDCFSRFPKGNSDGKLPTVVEVPYFDLNEDPSFWNDHNVQVLIRIRPISGMENASQGNQRCLVQESSQTLTWTANPETRFTFDHVACEKISQEKLFRVVGLPMVENCMSGYNSCMFAYGQTGSGKTYTMMGEIDEMGNNFSEDCGMTLRIFEYLFTRIREEEERRAVEQLKYSCKCSFLEIYNEQITDLLEPSSTNLQLREDIKKGVYVENLKEHEVSCVKDVVELLLQGTANRKMAATHMNSESSRSHSVLTCIIESQWEKNSMTHLRFGRLNLVDLAGSERQKSSGAEGERLKEAANINRSLSTLGLVIMTLVDITNGRNRHVPYRDSRLTFLLQDSLGGNSKTTIIANVSPSFCSASETLSTLKFAQRAKLIQNNAKVNEDTSGDVMALQRQIQKLKEQVTSLIKYQTVPRSLCYPSQNLEQMTTGDVCNDSNSSLGPTLLNCEVEELESALTSALRREEMAVDAVRRLEAEIKHMDRLVELRGDDAQRAKTQLRIREEKLRRLELLADDLVSCEGYLMEENVALSEEIRLLQERIDRNSELTQFALENTRLLEQLRVFQKFYQQGERDALLADISILRSQLLKVLEGKFALVNRSATQDNDTMKELDSCRRQLSACLGNNAKLNREVDDLRCQLKHYQDFGESTSLMVGYISKGNIGVQQTDKESSVELALVKGGSRDMVASSLQLDRLTPFNSEQGIEDTIEQFRDVQTELRDAKLLIKELESQQECLLAELNDVKQENICYLGFSKSKDIRAYFTEQLDLSSHTSGARQITECEDAVPATMERMHTDIEVAKDLNRQCWDGDAFKQASHHEMEHVHKQVEAETARPVLYLREELAAFQQEVDLKNASQLLSSVEHSSFLRSRKDEFKRSVCHLIQENAKLSDLVAARDAEISALSYEREKAITNRATLLSDGCRTPTHPCEYHIESVVDSFPEKRVCLNEHVERAMKVFIEKERLIADLQKRLEDAEKMGLEMKSKLISSRGSTPAKVQQLDNSKNSKEVHHITNMLGDEVPEVEGLQSMANFKAQHIAEASIITSSAFKMVERLNDMEFAESLEVAERKLIQELVNEKSPLKKIAETGKCIPATCETRINSMDGQNKDDEHDRIRDHDPKTKEYACALEEVGGQIEMVIQRISKSNDELCTLYEDTEKHIAAVMSEIGNTFSTVSMLFHDSTNVVCSIRKQLRKLQELKSTVPPIIIRSSVDGYTMMQIIAAGIAKANERLSYIKDGFDSLFGDHREPAEQEVYHRMNLQHVYGTHAENKFEECVGSLIPRNELISNLIEETEFAVNTLTGIRFQLNKLGKNDVAGCSFAQGSYSDDLYSLKRGNMISDNNCRHPTSREICQMQQTMEKMEEGDDVFSQTKKDAEKTKQASGLLMKFEAVQETMEEAELVLNALLKANEGAKHEKEWWKQTSAELLAEKQALIEEVQQLEASSFSKEKQYENLEHQIHAGLAEISSLTSSFKESFQYVHRVADEELNAIGSDIISSGKELLQSINTSRLWLEDMISEIMEAGFTLFVLHQCYRGSSLEQVKHSNILSDSGHHGHVKSCSVRGNGDIPDNKMILEETGREVIQNNQNFNFSHNGDTGGENQEMPAALSQVWHELKIKNVQIDNVLLGREQLEAQLIDGEAALSSLRSEMEQVQKELHTLSKENSQLKLLLEDEYIKRTHTEELLEDNVKVMEGLQRNYFSSHSSVEGHIKYSAEEIMDELMRVSNERDHLQAETICLTDKLDMARALADENEAIAVEARQVAEASKIYAEEKEEEVRVLEHSVEELEGTINILERKVYELKEEVENQWLIRKSLELEVQDLTQRLLRVENAAENLIVEYSNVEGEKYQIPRRLDDRIMELCEAQKRIKDLEMEKTYTEEEIKQYRDHISELVLHSEAQSALYQEKFKALEAMVSEVKLYPSTSSSNADKAERVSAKTRGSGSPFRCISGLVQQMNLERDRELFAARHRMEELEALVANKQKEVCMLTARLAAVDNMTHDVIRDLMGVKLDMTNYANIMETEHLQKLLETAQHLTEETNSKEKEIVRLKKQIELLIDERDSCMEEVQQMKADMLANQVMMERLQQRDQLLTAQNEMLKLDKNNLSWKITELDEKVKFLAGSQSTISRREKRKIQEGNCSEKNGNEELCKRIAQSDKLLFHMRTAMKNKHPEIIPKSSQHL